MKSNLFRQLVVMFSENCQDDAKLDLFLEILDEYAWECHEKGESRFNKKASPVEASF